MEIFQPLLIFRSKYFQSVYSGTLGILLLQFEPLISEVVITLKLASRHFLSGRTEKYGGPSKPGLQNHTRKNNGKDFLHGNALLAMNLPTRGAGF